MTEKTVNTGSVGILWYAGLVMLICAFLAVPAMAAPSIPDEFKGQITIGDEPAPVGTEILAKINWNVCGQITSTESGVYGETGTHGQRLVVEATDKDIGKTITFWVNGVQADQEIAYRGGNSQVLDLTFPVKTEPTPAPAAGEESSFDLTEVDGDGDDIVVDTQTLGDVTVEHNDDSIIIRCDNDNGWDELVFHIEGAPTENADHTLSGKVAGVTATTRPVSAEISGVGQVRTQIRLDTHSMPGSNAWINANVCEKTSESVNNAFVVAAKKSSDEKPHIAYVMNVNKKNVDAESGNDILTDAEITMTVDHKWVVDHGGRDSVAILRSPDNGGAAVRLETKFTGASGSDDIFTAKTDSLCVFAVVGVTTETKPVNPPHHNGGRSGGGSSSLVYATQTATPEATQVPEITVTETVAVTQTLAQEGTSIPAGDKHPETRPAGDKPGTGNSTGNPLYLIIVGILVLALAGGAYYYNKKDADKKENKK